MSNVTLFWTLILGPIGGGLLALAAPGRTVRNIVVMLSAAVTMAAGVLLATRGDLNISFEGHTAALVAGIIELAIVLTVLFISYRIKSWLVGLMALAQLGLVVSEFLLPALPTSGEAVAAADFIVDPLSTILVLVVTIIGSIITLYAIGYMRNHEHHAPPTSGGTGRFFFFLIAFLGFMNGLVLANSLSWLAIFWELTTLCSFMLIGHDGTPEAQKSARRALLINTFGGLAMMLAAVLARTTGHTESLSGLMGAGSWVLLPVALLCLASFTKSAQLPFQSWLLGAMVAPTPVSALLHSATMVKAGSYLVLRLSPAMAETHLSYIVAIAGGFTFAAASALAVGQSNGKKVLAYSTIANLGLIVACAGIGTPLAYAAGLFMLVFHAASKGLLFMCMGTIEQKIGSRDIEDMAGIMFKMPVTTVVMLLGMVSMLLPPLGMLVSKWLAIEAAINSPLILFLLVVGSALTVLFWAKWIGRIQTASYHQEYQTEKIPASMMITNVTLAAAVIMGGLLAVPILKYWIAPIAEASPSYAVATPTARLALQAAGNMSFWPFLVFLGLALLGARLAFARFKAANVRPPFLCGENIAGSELSYNFRTIGDQTETAYVGSYYLHSIITEPRLTFWANLLAWMIMLTLFGAIRAL